MPPFIQSLGHQGQFKNRNSTANLTGYTIQYLFISACCYIENVHYQNVTYTTVLCYMFSLFQDKALKAFRYSRMQDAPECTD